MKKECIMQGACPLSATCMNVCVWGEGKEPSRVMLVGEAPGFREDLDTRPFVGQAGALLDHVIGCLGRKRSDCYITNVIKCRPPNNKLPGNKEVDEIWAKCKEHFKGELSLVKPDVIVLMGNTALRLVTGLSFISRHEGAVLDLEIELDCLPKKKAALVACYHPAAVLRNPNLEVRLASALALAFKLAKLRVRPSKLGELFKFPRGKK